MPKQDNTVPLMNTVIDDLQEYNLLLKKLSQHYLVESHPHSKSYLTFKTLLLAMTSLTSALLYIQPSLAYGERFDSKKLEINEAVCNCISAILVLLNIAQIYINSLELRHDARKHLDIFLDKTDLLQKRIKDYLIISGAVLSALPLTAAFLQFNKNLNKGLLTVGTIAVTFDYSMIHTLPMQVLIENPFLKRLLILPVFHDIYTLIQNARLSDIALYRKALYQQKMADQMQLKLALCAPLQSACKTILDNSFKFNFKKLNYETNFTTEVKEIFCKPEGLDRYLELLRVADLLPRRNTRELPEWFRKLNPYLSYGAQLIGEVAMPTSIAGFYASTYNQIKDITNNSVASGIISALPIYVSAILVSYFGGKTVRGIYDYAVSSYQNTEEVPLAIRLYPKTVFLLYALAGYIAWYSSGPAEELVYTNFTGNLAFLRDALAGCARYGVQIYCFVNMFEIICNSVTLYANRFGNDDAKFATELVGRANALMSGIMLTDGEQLEKAIKALPSTQRENLLKMDQPKFTQLINHKENLKERLEAKSSISECYSTVGFLKRRKVSSEVIDAYVPTGNMALV